MMDTGNSREPAESGAVAQPGLKFLETSVYIMGGLLVLMLVGLIGGIIWKIATRGDVPPEVAKALSLDIPASGIDGYDLDGDRLMLKTADGIIIVDVKKGLVIARIALKGGAAP